MANSVSVMAQMLRLYKFTMVCINIDYVTLTRISRKPTLVESIQFGDDVSLDRLH